MKTFEYRGYDGRAHVVRGLVEASSLKEAREIMAGRGVLADRLTPLTAHLTMASAQRAVLYRELAVLLTSGLPLVRALEVLIPSMEMRQHGPVLAGVRDRVREGTPLARALGEVMRSVGEFEVAVVEAGEASATLPVMLERLAQFLEGQERTRHRIQSALTYPLIVTCAAICVAVVMLGVLIPRAQALWQGSRVALPAVTRVMMTMGRDGVFVLPFVILGGVLGAGLYRRRARTDAALRLRMDRLRFRLPVVGAGYALLAKQRFARTLAILLDAGIGLLDGLRLAARATGSVWVLHLTEIEMKAIEQGTVLSEALSRIPPLAEGLPGWVRIGEESGELNRLLEMAGRRYEELWDRFVMRRLALLEPLLILVIGVFVLLVVLAVLLPILSMTQSL